MRNTSLKSLPTKKLPKTDREQATLLGLIELFLKTGKPIGSQTLQEYGFDSLSSATIRNYFAKLEELGYLKQPHTSGGRVPTAKAFKLYTENYLDQGIVDKTQEEFLASRLDRESREVAATLHRAADVLSEVTQCAVFISAPRFDQDFVQDIRLIQLDPMKLLSVLITNFGLIRTETLYVEKPVDISFLRTVEEYFRWRMNQGEKPLFQNEAETKMAQRIYNEIMVRHVVGYANFSTEDVIRTGLSKLLNYPEFNDAAVLASSLSLLEDPTQMRSFLKEASKKQGLSCWIGDDLDPFIGKDSDCAIIAIPYRINQTIAGSIALLGPTRLPYRNLFGISRLFSEQLSQQLTEQMYQFKITFRQPKSSILLENQTREI
jgi:heat-inducible transcriptional repressor